MNPNDLRQRMVLNNLYDLKAFAPDVPLSKAMSFCERMASLDSEVYTLKCALGVLTEPLKFDEHGARPEALKNQSFAVNWALDQVMNCHGWIVCGPCEDGMGKLKKEIEQQRWGK
jgi:hypothetical protein